jgi:hypothetical protein
MFLVYGEVSCKASHDWDEKLSQVHSSNLPRGIIFAFNSGEKIRQFVSYIIYFDINLNFGSNSSK